MNKVELNKYIESICVQIPIVHSFYTDDVYEVWNTDEIKYGSVSFVVTNSSISDNTTTWTGMIYYADRLLEDRSNRDSVQSDANNVINAVMNVITQDDDIVTINYPTDITFFEQKFVDVLAGGYASIQIETDNSISKCGYGYIKDVEGCAGKIAELEAEIDALEERNDNLNDLNNKLNDALDDSQAMLSRCRESNRELTNQNQELTTENDRLEDEVERLEESLSILPNYTSIGYNLETADPFYQGEYKALAYAKKIQDEWNPNNGRPSYSNDLNLVYFPMVDTSNVTSLDMTFFNCNLLRNIPLLDISNVTNVDSLFQNCSSLTTIPHLNTSNVTRMRNLFMGCSSLTTVPAIDTSNVTDMFHLFYGCSSLTTAPPLNTSNVKDMQGMFYYCSKLESIPLLDTSNVTSTYQMFRNCSSLTTIPPLNTSNVTDFGDMFYSCTSLKTIPAIDTSKGTSMGSMFGGCTSLESLPLLDFSSYNTNTTNFGAFFGYSTIRTLTDLGGFLNFRKNWTGSGSLNSLPNLTVQSLLNVFNTIGDVTDLGGRKLEIGTTNLNKLTDEEKAIAINKGWTLT